MAKRGFFAELNYQAQQAEKRRRQQEAAAVRQFNATVRESERAQRAAARAREVAARTDEKWRRDAEKEATRQLVRARTAEVEAMNENLASSYQDIDTLLAWTIGLDDFVDLETLRVVAEHPPFDPGPLGEPAPPVAGPGYPPQPSYVEPPAPKGLLATFGGKKRHAEAVERAKGAHEQAQREWQEAADHQRAEHEERLASREKTEAERLAKLAEAEEGYRAECVLRDADAVRRNEELTRFINDLAFDVPYAIEDYVGVVLSNSVYPDAFPVEHEHTFDLSTRELTLQVNIPEPAALPTVKEYRYLKAKDEVVATQLTAKEQKDRYNSAVHQVALRNLHEVFEADRLGKIHSIALTVGVARMSPATGQQEFVPLVVVAADRDTFSSFELASVVPAATLKHLGAAVSKSPFDLTQAETSGVRQRSR